ncbi:AAA family ATPase [Candidatus Solirubrobacter pratensis]|uniref:AAA family ATPase n=1 Tax=Candidatus Solirubrobacter pratensis TaxID=1298857 RepID=UPI0004810AEC|nr:AAA family ATPase [Candidatus Solirubrobacter pratensis]
MPELNAPPIDTYEQRRKARGNAKPDVREKPWTDINAARRELFEDGSEFRPTSRDEIVGIDNVLERVDRVVHWLANAKDYLVHGARIEPGIILEGLPGTGKTSVCRYIATASGAHFINVRDWPHAGALYTDTDIRELFNAARAHYAATEQPVILFWDEFENAAVERGAASPEQVATVSQLTAELDGIHGKNEGLLLVGCTNYIYGIDAALKRPGRMGLQIEFHAPDRRGKRLILEHYLAGYNTRDAIDTETLSFFFDQNATAADIEEACVEAWTFAVHRALQAENAAVAPFLTQADLISVFITRLVGPPVSFLNLNDDARLRVAIHEVGHALAACIFGVPMRLITVQPGKKSLGRVMTAEVEDHIATVEEMEDHIRVSLGSLAAEEVTGHPTLLGARGDVAQANQMAARLVDSLYSGRRTGLFHSGQAGDYRASGGGGVFSNVSDDSKRCSDLDIRELLDDALADVRAALANVGEGYLRAIAEEVNTRVTLTGAEFASVVTAVTGVTNLTQYRA